MTNFMVLNKDRIAIGILDSIDSFIWNENYNTIGDFEIHTKFTNELFSILKEGYYITRSDSDRAMIIETCNIKPDPENGDKLIVTGRSLESLLTRRIILKQLIFDIGLETAIQTILDSEIISPYYSERAIPNFIFDLSNDEYIEGLPLISQYYMENVYDVIRNICEQNQIGFKIIFNASYEFVFQLYNGVDRSYDQITNPYVVFSTNFDNLVSSSYYKSSQRKKNVLFISGEDGLVDWNQGNYGKWAQVWTPDIPQGIDRREAFVDANYLPKTDSGGAPIPDADYVAQLEQRGYEELSLNSEVEIFEADIDITKSFRYRVDFFVGDILQIVDNYGHGVRVRLTGVTHSENTSGVNIYPTLKTL